MLTDSVVSFIACHWLAVVGLLFVVYLIRNRFHNGLNKYPGPFLASLTDWWRFWDVYGRRAEVTHQRLHEEYGDIVRLGPNTLSFADPKALKTIYGLNKGFVKSDFYVVQQAVGGGRSLPSLFSTTDNGFHQQFRRCVNSAFAMSSLVQYEPLVDNTTVLYLRRTEELYAGNPNGCDFTRWLQFYAFDVIGEITYSKRHGFIERNEDVDGMVGYLSNLFLYVAPIGQIPILDRLFLKNPIYLKLSQWGIVDATFPAVKFARARMAERYPELNGKAKKPMPMLNANGSTHHQQKPQQQQQKEHGGDEEQQAGTTATTTIQPVVTGPGGKPFVDLLSKFLAAKEARPDFMNDTLVQTMAVSMAFAGSETTAISSAAVFYYLLRTPQALATLLAEIDEAGRNGWFHDNETGLVTWQESQRLPYLDACVKEAFRMHPAPGLPMERIVPEPGLEIAGHFIKAGTIVGCSAWVIHRRAEVFGRDPYEYRPERWLPDPHATDPEAEERRIREMNGTMIQFGMGARTCIGKNISLLEIYKMVPSLLRRFEIRFKDPSQEWRLVNAWFIKQNNFHTTFKLRDIVQPDPERIRR